MPLTPTRTSLLPCLRVFIYKKAQNNCTLGATLIIILHFFPLPYFCVIAFKLCETAPQFILTFHGQCNRATERKGGGRECRHTIKAPVKDQKKDFFCRFLFTGGNNPQVLSPFQLGWLSAIAIVEQQQLLHIAFISFNIDRLLFYFTNHWHFVRSQLRSDSERIQ